MATYSIPQAEILGDSDLEGWPVVFTQLPDGEIFALNFVQDSQQPLSASTIEFLAPAADSIVDVTSAAYTGPIPTNVDAITRLAVLYVGSNTLPDILIPDYGLDEITGVGAQMKVLAPDANGQYANVTSALPQFLAYNQNVVGGQIDGQAAFAVSDIGNPLELLIANPDGTFTDWTSHIPSSVFSFPAGDGTYYNAAAIADFTGHGGDIFLGAAAGVPYNTLLINNGSGDFTADVIDAPKPAPEAIAEFVLPTQFSGDTHEDVIVIDANGDPNWRNNKTTPNYYIQFLQGNGEGGFTDVTAEHMPDQPILTDSFGNDAYVQSAQIVDINGFNDLILYTANGAPEIFLNNGQDVYSVSPVQVPGLSQTSYAAYDLSYTQWGVDDGVGGFFGYSSGNQWLFVPMTNAYLSPFSPVLNQPLADRLYLYGNAPGGAAATTLGRTFQTQISLTGDMFYEPGTASTIDVIVNGVDVGAQPFQQTYGSLDGAQEYTAFRTLTFTLPGLVDIQTLEITTNTPGLYLTDVSIDGVDLGNGANSVPTGNNMRDMTDVGLWNTAIGSSSALGTAADPIQVTGAGADVTAYVLGDFAQYAVTGIGTPTIRLSESAGLDQNAVLSNVAFIDFQDGTVLDTLTGVVSQGDGAGADDVVGAGATSSGFTVISGAFQIVYDGGTAVDVTVQAGGAQTVYGLASGTVLQSGAVQTISSQGRAIGTTVDSGGDVYVLSGGALGNAAVEWDGVQTVSADGTASGTMIDGGYEYVAGLALATTLADGPAGSGVVYGGQMIVQSGGVASGVIISSGGSVSVTSGGAIEGAEVMAGGALYVLNGATATGVTSAGGAGVFYEQFVSSGAVASGADLTINHTQDVADGGTAYDTTINGGLQNVNGFASGTVVAGLESSGQIVVGEQGVYYSGSAAATTLSSGGEQFLYSGSATDVTVLSAGVERIETGGNASGVVISSGGSAVVASGGSLEGVTVLGGGALDVDSDAMVSTLDLQVGAVIDAVYVGSASASLAADQLEITSGAVVVATLGLAGSGFSVTTQGDGFGGTDILILPPPSLPPDDFTGDGTSDLLIENTVGAVVVGALADGQAQYAQVTGLGPEWSFEGTGDFLGDGKTAFLIQNTVGAVVVGAVADGQAQFTQITALGPEWRFEGTGDFLGDGQDGFLIENTAGAIVLGQVGTNDQATFTQITALGPEWRFEGTGDFLGDGKSDFLIENTAGAVVVGEVVNGQAHFSQVTALGPEWQVVETGDFLGDGRSDFLIENTVGAVVLGEVVDGEAQFTQVTALGPQWSFVGAGDYDRTGIDSFLIENSAGALVTGAVVGGQAKFAQVGALGPDWRFHG